MTSIRTALFQQAMRIACFLFCAGVGLLFGASANGQGKRYRPPPDYVQFGRPNQEAGRAFLMEFRQKGFQGYLEFQLRVMPRRGEERIIVGRLWSDLLDDGPMSRIEVAPKGAADLSLGPEARLLIQGGLKPAVWRWQASDASHVAVLGTEALFERLGDTDLTAFDLQMPFLWWPDFVFEGVRKVRGRPANAFLFYPPADYVATQPDLTGVRVFLDTQYNALVQAEQIGAEGKVLKAMSVLDLKKVGDHWIVKSIDFRDDVTRNKTRFLVTAAAVAREFAPAVFAPGMLTDAISPPIEGLVRIAP